MTDKELLAVLDLPEDEQEKWMFIHGIIHHHPTDEGRIESLADLAFRLRDEFLKNGNHHHWEFALTKVWRKGSIHPVDVNQWANKYAQPIHWIIAALLAKQEKK